jgi:hypothetical protein
LYEKFRIYEIDSVDYRVQLLIVIMLYKYIYIYIYKTKNVKIPKRYTQYNLFNNVSCVQREDIASAWFYTIIGVFLSLSNYNFV